eukprot:1118204-Pelagomonas_calceolata.AAC.5
MVGGFLCGAGPAQAGSVKDRANEHSQYPRSVIGKPMFDLRERHAGNVRQHVSQMREHMFCWRHSHCMPLMLNPLMYEWSHQFLLACL